MRFFLRRAVAAQNRIELLLDTQTAQYGNRESMHLVAYNHPPLASKVIENLVHAGIQGCLVEKVAFVVREKNPHDLMKVIGAIFGQRMP